MERIVTHPLYIRCKKVIDSCETITQIDASKKYTKLCKKRMNKEYQKKEPNFGEIIDYDFALDYYFDKLWC